MERDAIKSQKNVPIIQEDMVHTTQDMENFAMARSVGVSELEGNVP